MSSRKHELKRLNFVIPGLVLVALLVIAAPAQRSGTASAGAPPPQLGVSTANTLSKIDAAVLQDTANGKSAAFIVLMAGRPDLTAAYGMRDQDARGWYVFNTLRSHATQGQSSLRAWLEARGIAYKSFWIANALVVTGDRLLAESIAARADVRKLESNRPFQGISPLPASADQPSSPQAIEWGVQRVNAPQLWAMGYRGQGIVVGNQDTGMRWTHQAIKNQYRGWNGATANHNYNWWDGVRFPITTTGNICGYATSEPCDDDEVLGGGHGTHTTGTAVGWDGTNNQIGVAPDAKWIGCRNLERGVGLPVTYLECFEFFLAPHDLNDANPDPTKRPHVMNNSWACVEGCAGDILRDAVESSQAAGIFVEVSAGNEGPACSTIAWEPQIYEASFDTGAIDIGNNLADFSSRGPVVRDGSLRLKPNISAPGVDVRSSLRGSDSEYGLLSGTSMAGPHVVGVVALLWSARPDLVRAITPTKVLLERSANPAVNVPDPPPICGTTTTTQIPNNHFGWGRVDALAALARAQATVTPGPIVTEMPTFTPGTPPTGTPLPTLSTATTTVIAGTGTPTLTVIAQTGTPTVVVGTGTPTLTIIAQTGTPTLTAVVTGTSTAVVTGTSTVVPTSSATPPLPTSTVPSVTSTPGVATATQTATSIVPTLTVVAPTSTHSPTVLVPTSTTTATQISTAIPTSTTTAIPTSIATPTCVAGWSVQSSANVGSYGNYLNGIAVVASNDIWAVGRTETGGTSVPSLIIHWDGGAWSVVSSPNGAEYYNELTAIDAVTANDIWAVGYSGQAPGYGNPLILHWNGSSWGVVPYSTTGGTLHGVAALSSDNVWAVGHAASQQTLVLRWNGTQWDRVASPNPGNYDNFLSGVTALSANDVWAVGYYNEGGCCASKTLILHWNGTQWSVVPSPSPGNYASVLRAIAAVAPDDIWAVGDADVGSAHQTLIEHWNGSAWSVVASPNAGTDYNFLRGVAAVSAGDVWAVGESTVGSPYETLILRWNGSAWNLVSSPSPGFYNGLSGVGVVSPNELWAAGYYYTDSSRTLTLRYRGTCGTPTPLATGTVTPTPVDGTPTATLTGVPTTQATPSAPPPTQGTATPIANTSTPVPPTSCPLEFTDVPEGSTFHAYVRCLVCRFIISGYSDNTFRPNNNITRGQIAKMVSNSAGINDNPGEQIYEDVNNTNSFYVWINRLSRRGYIGGYPCGTNVYEPCRAGNRPYFRPGANATRGQLSKIVATAAQFNDPVSGQFFEDVPDDNPFYVWIERLATLNIMGGYPCGGVNPQTGQPEPCVGPENRPYFRWANQVTRGQASKIVAGAFYPNCQTP